jgi:transcriptional regulator with XRE-family HTH domain
VATAAGISRSTYTRIEGGIYAPLSIVVASRIAAVLGLDLSVRVYPGAEALRDAAQVARLALVLDQVGAPLAYRTELALPPSEASPFEQRAWDAELTGDGERTTMEMEIRLSDAQALERRMNLKRRDDPADHFVLLVADTHHNRRVLRDFPDLFPELVRLSFNAFVKSLASGRHPPSSLVLVPAPPRVGTPRPRGGGSA